MEDQSTQFNTIQKQALVLKTAFIFLKNSQITCQSLNRGSLR